MRTVVMAILLLTIGQISGCASSGHLSYRGETYALNRSTFEKEEDGGYRIWAWCYEAGLLDYFGESPAGIQIWLPDDTASDGIYEVGRDCRLWVRGFWYLVGDLSGALWVEGESGTVCIHVWDPESKTLEGTFEAQMQEEAISGTLRVRPDTQD